MEKIANKWLKKLSRLKMKDNRQSALDTDQFNTKSIASSQSDLAAGDISVFGSKKKSGNNWERRYPGSAPTMCSDQGSCGGDCSIGQAQIQMFNECSVEMSGTSPFKTPDKGDPSPIGDTDSNISLPFCSDLFFGEGPSADCQFVDCADPLLSNSDCCTGTGGGDDEAPPEGAIDWSKADDCWYKNCPEGPENCPCVGIPPASWNEQFQQQKGMNPFQQKQKQQQKQQPFQQSKP